MELFHHAPHQADCTWCAENEPTARASALPFQDTRMTLHTDQYAAGDSVVTLSGVPRCVERVGLYIGQTYHKAWQHLELPKCGPACKVILVLQVSSMPNNCSNGNHQHAIAALSLMAHHADHVAVVWCVAMAWRTSLFCALALEEPVSIDSVQKQTVTFMRMWQKPATCMTFNRRTDRP
jgi:hypothetical protein